MNEHNRMSFCAMRRCFKLFMIHSQLFRFLHTPSDPSCNLHALPSARQEYRDRRRWIKCKDNDLRFHSFSVIDGLRAILRDTPQSPIPFTHHLINISSFLMSPILIFFSFFILPSFSFSVQSDTTKKISHITWQVAQLRCSHTDRTVNNDKNTVKRRNSAPADWISWWRHIHHLTLTIPTQTVSISFLDLLFCFDLNFLFFLARHFTFASFSHNSRLKCFETY